VDRGESGTGFGIEFTGLGDTDTLLESEKGLGHNLVAPILLIEQPEIRKPLARPCLFVRRVKGAEMEIEHLLSSGGPTIRTPDLTPGEMGTSIMPSASALPVVSLPSSKRKGA
jgi:hypothetical protein